MWLTEDDLWQIIHGLTLNLISLLKSICVAFKWNKLVHVNLISFIIKQMYKFWYSTWASQIKLNTSIRLQCVFVNWNWNNFHRIMKSKYSIRFIEFDWSFDDNILLTNENESLCKVLRLVIFSVEFNIYDIIHGIQFNYNFLIIYLRALNAE